MSIDFIVLLFTTIFAFVPSSCTSPFTIAFEISVFQYDLILLIEKSLKYRLLYIDLEFNDRNFPVIVKFDSMSTKMYGDYQTEYTKNTMKGNWCKIEELYLTL